MDAREHAVTPFPWRLGIRLGHARKNASHRAVARTVGPAISTLTAVGPESAPLTTTGPWTSPPSFGVPVGHAPATSQNVGSTRLPLFPRRRSNRPTCPQTEHLLRTFRQDGYNLTPSFCSGSTACRSYYSIGAAHPHASLHQEASRTVAYREIGTQERACIPASPLCWLRGEVRHSLTGARLAAHQK